MNVLDRFSAAGVRFRLDGDRVVAKLNGPVANELRAAMKALKEEIKSELEAIESRRQRLLVRLAEQPGQRYIVVYDSDASDQYDVLVVGIPSHTFEVRVPKPADSLEFAMNLVGMLERHSQRTDLQSEARQSPLTQRNHAAF